MDRYRTALLLFLLIAIPLVFLRWGYDPFEPHKVGLLLTGAAALATAALGGLFERGVTTGFGMELRRGLGAAIRPGKWDPLVAAVLLFLLSSALSTLASTRPLLSLFGSSARPAGFLVAVAMTLLFAASRSVSRDPIWLGRIGIAVTWTAGLASAYALLQAAGLDPIRWQGSATFGVNTRVPGPLGHPNSLGAYLAMALPLALWTAFRVRSGWARGASFLAAAASLLALGLTLSRGAWLGLWAGLVAYAALGRLAGRGAARQARSTESATSSRRRWLVAAALLILFLAPLATPFGASFLTRLRQIGDLKAPTSSSRIELWKSGLEMLRDHPWVGVGTDAFGAAFPRYRSIRLARLEWNAATDRAHSEVVQIAATQGLVGLLAALCVAFFAWRACLRIARGLRSPPDRSAAVVGASLAAWAVSSGVGFSVAATGSLAAILAGWVSGRSRGESLPERRYDRHSDIPTSAATAWAALGAAAILIGAIWLVLVVPPWRAAFVGGRALALPEGSPEQLAGLDDATRLAPWDDRWPAAAGLARLRIAFVTASPDRAWSELAGAMRGYDDALRIAPSDPAYAAYRARILAEQAALRPVVASPEDAARALDVALAADPHGSSTLALATEGYLRLGRLADAHHAAHRAAWLYPDFALPMLEVGSIALDEGRLSDAVDTLQLALGRSWRDGADMEPIARARLAYAYLQLGRDREAENEAGRALLLDPANALAADVRRDALRAQQAP